ncbi:MAG: hypothetical protein JST84_03470 [Acidobacteria bacterium]|nr:hypothetical protein [Acidobacteriota bacterium]
MKQLSLSQYPQPMLIKATAHPRRKSVIFLRRARRFAAMIIGGLFVLLFSPFTNGRRTPN